MAIIFAGQRLAPLCTTTRQHHSKKSSSVCAKLLNQPLRRYYRVMVFHMVQLKKPFLRLQVKDLAVLGNSYFLLKVAFSQKVLMHLSFPQTCEPFIFLSLRMTSNLTLRDLIMYYITGVSNLCTAGTNSLRQYDMADKDTKL